MARKRQSLKCKARKTNGEPCGNYALTGATVCTVPGRRAPQVRAKAERNVRERAITDQLARLDAAPVGNPLEELQRLAGQAVSWKDAMAGKVNELTGLSYKSTLGQEQVRSELLLWERALDRCTTVLVAIAKLGIDERLARVEERKAELIAVAVREAITAAGVGTARAEEVKHGVVLRLRALESS
jgi:hypothetical protein